MVRIAGVDLPSNKRMEIALTYIYGIGRSMALEIVDRAKIDPARKAKDLTESEVVALRDIIKDYEVEDIPFFINYFLAKYNKELNKDIKYITGEALNVLQDYSWPGNVRELENLIERIATLSKDDHIDAVHLPKDLINSKPNNNGAFNLEEGSLMKAVRNFEKKIVIDALRHCNGNQTSTAKTLGIHRTTLISKLEAYGIKD